MKKEQEIFLNLKNGMEFKGHAFGGSLPGAGEVVFNTAMTGYPESLTDPSYNGQILVLTYPLIGNYGVPKNSKVFNLSEYFESDQVQINGLVISDYTENYSHWNANQSLGEWLKTNNVPGIYGIDTRRLTKILRDYGTMLGKIRRGTEEIDYYDPNQEFIISKVSTKEKKVYGTGDLRVLLIDCGVKNNIIRCLLKRDVQVIRVPYDHDISKEEYDGILISNGPGNPEQCTGIIKLIKDKMAEDKPIFGICLGTQIMAMAAGAKVFKLKYGHRSHNQPVRKVGTHQTYITSQNHGYAIKKDTLPDDWEILFENLNDFTIEGIKHLNKPFSSVQFHPEASGGPSDTMHLFDDFIKQIKQRKN